MYSNYKVKHFIGDRSVVLKIDDQSDKMRVVISHCDGNISIGNLSLAAAELYLDYTNVCRAVDEDVFIHKVRA